MRILHFLSDKRLPQNPDEQAVSGIIRVALETACAQAELGHDVWVASISNHKWQCQWRNITLVSLKQFSWAYIRNGNRHIDMRAHLPFVLFTYTQHFDIVLGYGHYYMRFVRATARFVNIQTPPLYGGHKADERIMHTTQDAATIRKYTQAQIMPSNYIAAQFASLTGRTGNDLYVIPNGVDSEKFAPAKHVKTREELRKSWGITEEHSSIVILFSGAIVPEKGLLHLAASFRKIAAQYPNIYLVIAGASNLWGGLNSDIAIDYEKSVYNQLELLCNNKRAVFLGNVSGEKMPEIYTASDIVVVPSVWGDPFPLVVLEALASGKPVIASSTGGIPEMLSPETGILTEPGNETMLEEAILQLALDEKLQKKMGSAARQSAQKYTWKQVAEQIDTIYQKVTNKKPK